MLIDCGRCTVRGSACDSCVVTALFDAPDGLADLTSAERRAIEVFDLAGLDVEILSTPPALLRQPLSSPAPAGRRRTRHVA